MDVATTKKRRVESLECCADACRDPGRFLITEVGKSSFCLICKRRKPRDGTHRVQAAGCLDDDDNYLDTTDSAIRAERAALDLLVNFGTATPVTTAPPLIVKAVARRRTRCARVA